MRNKSVQMSFLDIYNGVLESMEEKKPELVRLLEEHIDFDGIIPSARFTAAMGVRTNIIWKVLSVRSFCRNCSASPRTLF